MRPARPEGAVLLARTRSPPGSSAYIAYRARCLAQRSIARVGIRPK